MFIRSSKHFFTYSNDLNPAGQVILITTDLSYIGLIASFYYMFSATVVFFGL